VRGHKIGEFPEEEEAVNAALGGLGKRDWYRSTMAQATRRAPLTGDISRQYNIAFAEEIPGTSRIVLAVVNWESIQKILDDIEPPMAEVGFPSTYAFMFARDSDLVIAHHYRDPADRNNYGTAERRTTFPMSQRPREAVVRRYEYPAGSRKSPGSRVWILLWLDRWSGVNDADVVALTHERSLDFRDYGVVIVLLSLGVACYLCHHSRYANLRLQPRGSPKGIQAVIVRSRRGQRLQRLQRDECGAGRVRFEDFEAADGAARTDTPGAGLSILSG
jgi:hypothetical protein